MLHVHQQHYQCNHVQWQIAGNLYKQLVCHHHKQEYRLVRPCHFSVQQDKTQVKNVTAGYVEHFDANASRNLSHWPVHIMNQLSGSMYTLK
jgi:hypothetical protein